MGTRNVTMLPTSTAVELLAVASKGSGASKLSATTVSPSGTYPTEIETLPADVNLTAFPVCRQQKLHDDQARVCVRTRA